MNYYDYTIHRYSLKIFDFKKEIIEYYSDSTKLKFMFPQKKKNLSSCSRMNYRYLT